MEIIDLLTDLTSDLFEERFGDQTPPDPRAERAFYDDPNSGAQRPIVTGTPASGIIDLLECKFCLMHRGNSPIRGSSPKIVLLPPLPARF